jgi:P27 family predicted phage terminase small subunit
MVKGRKPKPTHLKLIEGNPGKRELNRAEPEPRETEPEKPDFTTGAASACWDRIVVELRAMGILHAADRDALEIYCEAYGTWKTAQAGVAKGVLVNRGTDDAPHPVTNPSWRVARDAGAVVLRIGESFGLTPSARTRIELPATDDGDLGALFTKPD